LPLDDNGSVHTDVQVGMDRIRTLFVRVILLSDI
jgi:hypothetical protein